MVPCLKQINRLSFSMQFDLGYHFSTTKRIIVII